MFETDIFGQTSILVIVPVFVFILYWYATRNFDYWKKRGVPYAKPFPFVGSLIDNLKKPIHEVEEDRYKKFGSIYGHFEGNSPLLTVADPELLRGIFVKDFPQFINRRSLSTGDKIVDSLLSSLQGEDWKRIRAIVSPSFSSGKLKRMISIFQDCSDTLVKNFKTAAMKKEQVELKEIYGAYTMDIIASSAFSMKFDSHNDPNNRFVQVAKKAFSSEFGYRIALLQLFPMLMRILQIPAVSPVATTFFKDVTLQIIEERKRTGQVRNDFLQLLLDTAKEVSEDQKWDQKDSGLGDITSNYGADESSHQIPLKNVSNKSLNIDELVGQCVIFFLAGYDTTGSLLSFVTYLLALHEDIQEKAFEEVKKVLVESKGKITYETIQSMKYLDNIISETLRLYPPVIRQERVAQADYKLGDTGITIPKGMLVTIPCYNIHRDAKYFPDPEKFDPDRFSPEERANMTPYTFLPFGSGPRNCVGMRFALLEAKFCLVHVIGTFKIKRCAQTKVPLDFVKGQVLLIPKETKVEMELRSNGLFK